MLKWLVTLAVVAAFASQPSSPRMARVARVEFRSVRFDIPVERVVGAHYVGGPSLLKERQFKYTLESAPRDTTATLEMPDADHAIEGRDLAAAGASELIRRHIPIVNQIKPGDDLAAWTRPDYHLVATVIDVTFNTFVDPPRMRSESSVIVEWRLHDPETGEVIYQIATQGRHELDDMSEECILFAFVDALRALAEERGFVESLSLGTTGEPESDGQQ